MFHLLLFGDRAKKQNMRILGKNFEKKTRAGVGDTATCILFELEKADTDIVRLACCFGDREEKEEHDHAARSF